LQEDKTGNVLVTLYCVEFLLTRWGLLFWGSILKVALLYGYGKTHRFGEMMQIW